MTECSLVYDLLLSGYDTWRFPLVGVITGAALALMYVVFRAIRVPISRGFKITFVLQMILALAWTIAGLIWSYDEYAELARRYRRGDFIEVSGKVENFDQGLSPARPGDERFTVNGVTFFYSQNMVSAGFRKTHNSGGPLRDGMTVKIRYIGSSIVRLEICEAS